MKKQLAGLFITVFLIVLILGAAAVIYVQVRFANKEEVRNATIEMREYSVSTKIPGRIEWIAVDEGDVVDVNQEIFVSFFQCFKLVFFEYGADAFHYFMYHKI